MSFHMRVFDPLEMNTNMPYFFIYTNEVFLIWDTFGHRTAIDYLFIVTIYQKATFNKEK